MGILSFIIAIVFTNKLHKKYRWKILDNPLWFLAFILIGAGLAYMLLPMIILGFIILRVTGALDAFGSKNDKKNIKTFNHYVSNNNRDWRNWNQVNPQATSAPYNNVYTNNNYSQPVFNKPVYGTPLPNIYELPKKQAKRAKLIKKFNEKYSLCLTDKQIDCISAATYFSPDWARLVKSMDMDYDSVYAWLNTDQTWIRVYLLAFSTMNISSDFQKQEYNVFSALDQIFSDICNDESLPIEVVIENINYKYLTTFDEATFSLAMKYMESKGKKYKYGDSMLVSARNEMDNLMNKYQV